MNTEEVDGIQFAAYENLHELSETPPACIICRPVDDRDPPLTTDTTTCAACLTVCWISPSSLNALRIVPKTVVLCTPCGTQFAAIIAEHGKMPVLASVAMRRPNP